MKDNKISVQCFQRKLQLEFSIYFAEMFALNCDIDKEKN